MILTVSIVRIDPSFKALIALVNPSGIPKCLAKPFPEPAGIIAKVVFVLTKTLPTSLIVPSPPTATMISGDSTKIFSVNIAAWFGSLL